MLLFKVISRCYDPGKTREVTRIVFFKITLFFLFWWDKICASVVNGSLYTSLVIKTLL